MLIVSPGRCIQNYFFILRNLQFLFDHPDIFLCMIDKKIISRITDFHDFIFHLRFFQIPCGSKFLTGKS